MWSGLGDDSILSSAITVRVYLANRPPMAPYDQLAEPLPLQAGEVYSIAQHTGNHWRKIFNVYAKLMHAFLEQAPQIKTNDTRLNALLSTWEPHATWQSYRDAVLLQQGSCVQLRFSAPVAKECLDGRSINIIMGKGYAEQLGFPCAPPNTVADTHGEFAFYKQDNVLVCPYFDYRQLSNAKIDILVGLMWQALVAAQQEGQ